MTKTRIPDRSSAFLLIVLFFGMISSVLSLNGTGLNLDIDEDSFSIPKASQLELETLEDDEHTVVLCYFENTLNDVHDHSASSIGMSYIDKVTPSETPNWDQWVDKSTGGDWVTFNVNHNDKAETARLNHIYDGDPGQELAAAITSFGIPLDNLIIETSVALGSNDVGCINFVTYNAEYELLHVVELLTNGRVRPYNNTVTERVDNITDSTDWLDIRLDINATTQYDLYINDNLVGDNFDNYMGNEGPVAHVGFYGGIAEEDDFEAYCAYVRIESNETSIEGDYSAVIDSGTDYARWYDTMNYTQGTLECFFMPTVIPLNDSILYYVLNGGNLINPMIGVYMQNGFLHAYHSSANGEVSPLLHSPTRLEPGTLYHIAYTFGPLGTHLYINGVDENFSTDTRILDPGNRYVGIGKINSPDLNTSVSAQGRYDFFRWSSVQRTDFPSSPSFGDRRDTTYSHPEFDDSDAIILSSFENNLNDVRGHTVSSNEMSFVSAAIQGDYSGAIDTDTAYARWYDTADYTQGTLECLFRPLTVSLNDDAIYYILNGGDGAYSMIGIYLQNGWLRAYHNSANYLTTPLLQSLTRVEPGELYHIAYTFGPSGTHLYINGIEEDSSTDTRILNPYSRYVGVGKVNSLKAQIQFSASGEFDLFRWSAVQRTSFLFLVDFGLMSAVESTTQTDHIYEIDAPFDLFWGHLYLGGGILVIIFIIKIKKTIMETSYPQQHETLQTAQIETNVIHPQSGPTHSRFCSCCGQGLEDRFMFCTNCGEKL